MSARSIVGPVGGQIGDSSTFKYLYLLKNLAGAVSLVGSPTEIYLVNDANTPTAISVGVGTNELTLSAAGTTSPSTFLFQGTARLILN